MPEPSVTRPSTVESFLKTTTGLRVGPKPVEVFLAQLDALALAVAKKATELAQADGNRPTILERDVTQAFDAVGGIPSGPPDPAAVFTQLDRLTTDQLAALINQIRAWLDARERPR